MMRPRPRPTTRLLSIALLNQALMILLGLPKKKKQKNPHYFFFFYQSGCGKLLHLMSAMLLFQFWKNRNFLSRVKKKVLWDFFHYYCYYNKMEYEFFHSAEVE
uniref:Uncharacterized protein n=1 Tax=Cacopsylla melanoneura TaxID=428564 RepID=A0A8D8PWP8_9HEMI